MATHISINKTELEKEVDNLIELLDSFESSILFSNYVLEQVSNSLEYLRTLQTFIAEN